MVVRRILHYDELRMHVHLTNTCIRIRAGWDKILNNVLGYWLGLTERNWSPKFPGRVAAINRYIDRRFPGAAPMWADIRKNADDVQGDGGLRKFRDGDLH